MTLLRSARYCQYSFAPPNVTRFRVPSTQVFVPLSQERQEALGQPLAAAVIEGRAERYVLIRRVQEGDDIRPAG